MAVTGVVAAVGFALCLALVVARPSTGGTPSVADPIVGTGSALPDRVAGPVGYRDRVPFGFDETEAGARSAAVAYAAEVEQRMLYLDDAGIDRAQRQVSAAARVDRLLVERRRSVEQWRSTVQAGVGQLWWVVTPLASRVEAFTAGHARVSVWVSFVVSRSGSTAPRVWFGVQTVEVVREADDWKLWSQSLESGPTPQLAAGAKPSDATELNDRLDGFLLITGER